MKFPLGRRNFGALGLLLALAAGLAAASRLRQDSPTIAAPDESEVELTVEHEGATYKVIRGAAYRVGPDPGRLMFVETLYDPNFYAKNYVIVDGVPNRKDPDTGTLYPTRRHLEEGFEGAASLTDLIGPRRGWTTLTLQSPRAPTVPEYVALRQRILSGQGDFLDNRVEVEAGLAHSGERSLRCYSVAPSRGMICAKSSLSTELLHFAKGDDVWFSAWFQVATGGSRPLTVADLESTWIKEYPGMRIMLDPSGCLMAELKWADKPTYRQQPGREVAFPMGRWANVRMHLRLSERADGRVELWQDSAKIIDAEGPTLPLAGAIYDELELGISAHDSGPAAATLFVDDVVISAQPIP
jgi:hypothetical protein